MKVNELVNTINGIYGVKAGSESRSIDIYSLKVGEYDYFLDLNFNSRSWDEVSFDYECLEGVRANSLGKVLELVDEFLKTPLKDRFPEKKYRLRWVDDNDGTSNYLDHLAGEWRLLANEDVRIFTETELQQLKINNPRLAPAIDAMKEPVEK